MALERLPNGITIRAMKPKVWYEGNQTHELEGVRYFVPLTNYELME